MGTVTIDTEHYDQLVENNRVLCCVKVGTVVIGQNIPVRRPVYFTGYTTYELLDPKDVPTFGDQSIDESIALVRDYKERIEILNKAKKELRIKLENRSRASGVFLFGFLMGVSLTLITAVLF